MDEDNGAGAEPDALDQLVQAVRAGEHGAFRQIVFAVQGDLRLFIAWRLGVASEVEDVLQETLLTAYNRLETYRCCGTFRAWLRGIARNHIRQTQRERRRLAQHHRADLDSLVDAAAEGDDERHTAELQRLRLCLESLNSRARRLIELRYLRQLSLGEVAQHARQPKARLSVRLHRIRRSLLECMQQAGAEA
ncbi:MAG: RNA polymerase sigma factor [Planctomycetota bacterium]